MVKMMRDEFPYLATQWVHHKHPIAEFPPALLACPDSTSFLTTYRNILLPSLLECDRSPAMEFLENLAGKCGREVKDLFADNFSTLMAHIFPFIAAEQANYTSVSKARVSTYTFIIYYLLLQAVYSIHVIKLKVGRLDYCLTVSFLVLSRFRWPRSTTS